VSGPHWWLTKDGDKSLLALYEKHYSAYHYKDGRKRRQCVGPGFTIVLRTENCDAGFVWRKFIDDSDQEGINCAFFRNEGPIKASELIRQADAIADHVWPSERHYTFVDPEKIRGTLPGYCFLRAGWKRCKEQTKSGKLILARRAKPRNDAGINCSAWAAVEDRADD
jgi:hypothetical protein